MRSAKVKSGKHRACTRKKQYQHQGQAQRAAEKYGLRAYPCRYCTGWHLTSGEVVYGF